MRPFTLVRPAGVAEALRELSSDPAAQIIAGGTNLVDLMKYDVARPTRLVDITRLPGLDGIEATADGGLRIGALVRNTTIAYHPAVERDFGLLASAILAGASPQLRNAASTGGNLLQRTRCYYFYDVATPCNKRAPGSGCPAIAGANRLHAILGGSEQCIATHPSDMCVGLAALDAVVIVAGASGERRIPFADFHLLPGDDPARETALRRDEIVLAVELPASTSGRNYTYLKLRDRASYAFALVSVAAAITFDGDRIGTARLALGGVAHRPWRDREAEAMLAGARADRDAFRATADHVLRDARGYGKNDFKIELARRAIVRALQQAADGQPQRAADKALN